MIPELTADDFCHGSYEVMTTTKAKRCLVGWCRHCGGHSQFDLIKAVKKANGITSPIHLWNDSHRFEECAEAWNKARPELEKVLET